MPRYRRALLAPMVDTLPVHLIVTLSLHSFLLLLCQPSTCIMKRSLAASTSGISPHRSPLAFIASYKSSSDESLSGEAITGQSDAPSPWADLVSQVDTASSPAPVVRAPNAAPVVTTARNVALSPFPRTWSRMESQLTGTYHAHVHQFGLKKDQWHAVRGPFWGPLETALSEQAHDLTKRISASTILNIEDCLRAFTGYLVKVKGLSLEHACKHRNLVTPNHLNGFWKFFATPRDPYHGRGASRSYMRMLCNSIGHLLLAVEVVRGDSFAGPTEDCTPAAVRAWWLHAAQPRCNMCPQGERATSTRGQADIWPTIQEAVKEAMCHVADLAGSFKKVLDQGHGHIDEHDLLDIIMRIQAGLLLGPCGITAPPMRAGCAPSLHQPGSQCPRQLCIGSRHQCSGNTWEVTGDADGHPTYSLVFKHYKNSDKGGYVGSSQIVKLQPQTTGPIWQELFWHWVTWARAKLLQLLHVVDHGYTFMTSVGKPWRSAETLEGQALSTWLHEQMQMMCRESGYLTDDEIERVKEFTPQDARSAGPPLFVHAVTHVLDTNV